MNIITRRSARRSIKTSDIGRFVLPEQRDLGKKSRETLGIASGEREGFTNSVKTFNISTIYEKTTISNSIHPERT